jgi:hypothetical protein
MKTTRFLAVAAISIALTSTFFACSTDDGEKNNGDPANKDPVYGWYGNGSATNYTISTAAQLGGLANIVKGRGRTSDGTSLPQDDFVGKTITLTADIDMSGQDEWRGIGYSYISLSPFNGTFDGNNKTISSLQTDNQGFFGYIGENGIVKDMIFIDLSYESADGGGGLARRNEGTIQNVSISGSGPGGGGIVSTNYGIIESSSFSGDISFDGGGIARTNAESGVIRDCHTSGNINGGGIVNTNSGIVESSYSIGDITTNSNAGGIVKSNNRTGIVKNCYATGNVINTSSGAVGGIVGSNSGTVENCYSTGNVTGTTAGGAVGSNASAGIVRNCYATGNVSGTRAGGVIGDNSGTVENCYATGNVSSTNFGGGVVGDNSYSTIRNCVALNQSVTRSSGSATTFGRVIGGALSSLSGDSYSNNYAQSEMTLPNGITVASDATGKHGEDITSDEWNNADWWQNTAEFPSSAWEFRAGLPILGNMPTGTQNPEAQ